MNKHAQSIRKDIESHLNGCTVDNMIRLVHKLMSVMNCHDGCRHYGLDDDNKCETCSVGNMYVEYGYEERATDE